MAKQGNSESITNQEYCYICGRHLDQLEPYDDIESYDECFNESKRLRLTYRTFLDMSVQNMECKDCIGIPVDPHEVFCNPDVFLLNHCLDTDTWTTFVHKWEDEKLDRLLADDKDWIRSELDYSPKFSGVTRYLKPDEVEKIKAAPGKTIIVVSTRVKIDERSGVEYKDICKPPEVIENIPK